MNELEKKLISLGNREQSKILQRFFKTGPGEYGEGDLFIGIKVPVLRKTAVEHKNLPMPLIKSLLSSSYHECRMVALLILTERYKKGDEITKKEIFNLYLSSIDYINNWDLIDLTAPHITGHYLSDKKRDILYKLAKSDSLWKKRIAILSTFYYIRHDDFIDTFRISDILIGDKEDLIHKAVGWMLRETGKRNRVALEHFLASRYQRMPRTMLRYAIERFPERLRQQYLKGKISSSSNAGNN